MAGFGVLVSSLRRAEKTLESQLSSVRSAISTLTEGGRDFVEGLVTPGSGHPKGTRKRRRKLSVEGRAAIAAAQKKRWAKIKAEKRSSKGG